MADLNGGSYTLATFSWTGGVTINGGSVQSNGTHLAGTGASGSVAIDPSSFVGSLSTGDQFSLDVTGGNLVLTYTPVPEAATVLGIAVAAFGAGGLLRRRLKKPRLAA